MLFNDRRLLATPLLAGDESGTEPGWNDDEAAEQLHGINQHPGDLSDPQVHLGSQSSGVAAAIDSERVRFSADYFGRPTAGKAAVGGFAAARFHDSDPPSGAQKLGRS